MADSVGWLPPVRALYEPEDAVDLVACRIAEVRRATLERLRAAGWTEQDIAESFDPEDGSAHPAFTGCLR